MDHVQGNLAPCQALTPPLTSRCGSTENVDYDLTDLAARIAPCFGRVETRRQAFKYISALLQNSGQRKNGWQIAKTIGDEAPWRTQRLLNRARWDADLVRDIARDYVVSGIGDPNAVLALGELATVKKGGASVGVAPQFDTATGRLQNCQIAIFASYVSRYGEALIDRRLYLPPSWANDQGRRHQAGIPSTYELTSKADLTAEIVRQTAAARVPFSWVTGDVELGRDAELRTGLSEQGLGYVLAVPGNQLLVGPAGKLITADFLARHARRNCRELRKDTGRSWWASIPIVLPVEPEGAEMSPAPGHVHLLLVCGGGNRPRCYLAHAVEMTPLAELIRVARSRAAFDGCIGAAQERVGLDNYEVRTWTAWHRHVTLAMVAALAPSGG
jgi:SRSO17 transposase